MPVVSFEKSLEITFGLLPADAARDENGHRAGENAERPPKYVTLSRRFPGESEDSPYLEYCFRDGVEGRLSVRYEKQVVQSGSGRSPFVMTNEQTHEEGVCTELTPEESYLHPVQRGDL